MDVLHVRWLLLILYRAYYGCDDQTLANELDTRSNVAPGLFTIDGWYTTALPHMRWRYVAVMPIAKMKKGVRSDYNKLCTIYGYYERDGKIGFLL